MNMCIRSLFSTVVFLLLQLQTNGMHVPAYLAGTLMVFVITAEGLKEAEVSKRRRDWAFSERDKIVRERESIRAHSDKLRREKDRAVSNLAEALRDSDDMMKQRNELARQLKQAK